jgi:diguanylate cyclase (GGDEF)-like protein
VNTDPFHDEFEELFSELSKLRSHLAEQAPEAERSLAPEFDQVYQRLDQLANPEAGQTRPAALSRTLELLQNAPVAILHLDPKGRVTYANPAAYGLFPRVKAVHPPTGDLGPIIRKESTGEDMPAPEFFRSLNAQKMAAGEYELWDARGDHKSIWVACAAFEDAGTNPGEMTSIGVTVAIQDITQVTAAQAQKTQVLEALRSATLALLSTLNLDALLGKILDAAQTAFPAAEKGMLHLIAPDTGQLQLRAALGYSDPRIKAVTFPKTQDHLARVVTEQKPLLVENMIIPPGQTRIPDTGELGVYRSAIVAPLILSGRVLGVISLQSQNPYAFTPGELRLLDSFAATITVAIQNAMLHAEVQHMAVTDALTGLYNRRGFLDLGQREVERFQRFGRPLSLIMLDIDHFKEVNDAYGHASGDTVLRELSKSCRTIIRQVDIIGRYGGDEFVILLPETDTFMACEVADRLRREVESLAIRQDQAEIKTTISLGVSRALKDTQNLAELIERADAALYNAKHNGRNRIEVD